MRIKEVRFVMIDDREDGTYGATVVVKPGEEINPETIKAKAASKMKKVIMSIDEHYNTKEKENG